MSESNDKILAVGKNANDTAALVWSVADDLVGVFFARPKCRKLQSGHVGCCNNKM